MITLILGVFHHFCKSARSASRQRENFMESLHSDGSATYLLIIWVEKIIPLGMKSKQKPYPSIVFSKYSFSVINTINQKKATLKRRNKYDKGFGNQHDDDVRDVP